MFVSPVLDENGNHIINDKKIANFRNRIKQ